MRIPPGFRWWVRDIAYDVAVLGTVAGLVWWIAS